MNNYELSPSDNKVFIKKNLFITPVEGYSELTQLS